MNKNKLGLNLNDLSLLARKNPKYAKLLGELAGIDQIIKNFANDIITNYSDPNVYFIKTELLNQCYNLYLYNSERNATIGYSWLFDDFLTKCQTKVIEKDVEKAVKKMIDSFNNDKKLSEKKINWIIV